MTHLNHQFSVSGSLEKPNLEQTCASSPLTLNLYRYPSTQISNLQAWDAADEHLINQVLQNNSLLQLTDSIAIINDNFGALTCAVKKIMPSSSLIIETDAKTSELGIKHNLEINQLNSTNISWKNSRENLTIKPILTLMKLPKNLNYFASQLALLSQTLPQGSKVLIGAKAKAINGSFLNLIEKNLGSANPSLCRKKTRVITVIADGDKRSAPASQNWKIANYQLNITNLTNVFAANKLDIGARLLLENMPKGDFNTVIDLGCGNGVLGLRAAQLYPKANIHFVDDSEMAVQSSQNNWQLNQFEPAQGHFHWSDCLTHLDESINPDLILCNPPFHQGEAITDHIAWQMFNDARKKLVKGGILHVVGNRHLGYHIKLQRLFGHCKTIASNGKFVIFQVQK